jgi:hypothetical protein
MASSSQTEQPHAQDARDEPQLHYLAHFALLAAISSLLLVPATSKPIHGFLDGLRWRSLSGIDAEFALYGLMHALAVAVTLRSRPPAWRLLVFLTAAAVLDIGVFRFGAALWDGGSAPNWPVILIPACAGALAYAVLIRLLIRFRAAAIAAAPVAGWFGCLAGMAAAHLAPTPALLIVGWWLAFSVWLYYADRWPSLARRARAEAAERRRP